MLRFHTALRSHAQRYHFRGSQRWLGTSSKEASNPVDVYLRAVDAYKIQHDEHQFAAVQHLNRLHHQLCGYKPAQITWKHKWGLEEIQTPPKGVYMHGGVGCGKTFIMDMFFKHAPVERKRRVHFHSFMLEVHERMHTLRQVEGLSEDPIPVIAKELSSQSWLFCFDEMQVTDVADALILRRLFSEVIANGTVIVATSNRPPKDLYKNGLQRALFIPFIKLLEEKCHVESLDASETDYRQLKGEEAAADRFMYPLEPEVKHRFESLFKQHTKGNKPQSTYITSLTGNRELFVEKCVVKERLAKFSFDDLCAKPLGAADYISIANAFDTVFIADIPVLDLNSINQARRFITLIDCLYEAGVNLYICADGPIQKLFTSTDKSNSAAAHDEVFAFDRTVSRLLEMRSVEYIQAHEHVETDRNTPPNEELLSRIQFHNLSQSDIQNLWVKYDVDGNGRLDRHELHNILEDLCFAKFGHRNVPLEVVDETLGLFRSTIPDREEKSDIDFAVFMKTLKKYDLQTVFHTDERTK